MARELRSFYPSRCRASGISLRLPRFTRRFVLARALCRRVDPARARFKHIYCGLRHIAYATHKVGTLLRSQPSARGVLTLLAAIFVAAIPQLSNATRSLLHIPSAEVLPMGGISISTDLRGFFDYKNKTTSGLPKMRTGFTANYGFLEVMEGGITFYSSDPGMRHASGQVRVLLMDEGNLAPAMSAGFMDISGNKHPVEYSGYPITLSAYNNYPENKSLYFVARKGLGKIAKAYLGIGGGRFKGHGPENSKLHGIFGGGELRLLGPVNLMGEVDGRNVNAGAGMAIGTLRPGHGLDISVNASLWSLYLQNMRKASKDIGLSPAYSAKLDFGMVLPSIRWGKAGTAVDEKKAKAELDASTVVLRPKTMDFNNPVADWKINLTNPRGQVIRTYSGVGLPPKVFEWDGLDDRGGIVTTRAKIKMELTVRDVAGVEKMDVVPVDLKHGTTVEVPKTDYGKAVEGMMDWKTAPDTQLRALASRPGPDGKASLYQVRANELLGYLARKEKKPAEARQYALRAGELSRTGGLSIMYKNPRRDNLWNLAGELMGDYRLWPVLYEANMDSMSSPMEMVPAGRMLRVPKEVLEEDYARAIKMFMETTPPVDFNPGRSGQE